MGDGYVLSNFDQMHNLIFIDNLLETWYYLINEDSVAF